MIFAEDECAADDACSNRGECLVSRSDVNEATGEHEQYTFACDCDVPSEVLRYEGEHCEIATVDGEDVCFNGGSIRFVQNK